MRILDVTARAGGLAVVWFVVSEGRTEYWYYGVITVAAALAVSLATRPPRAVSFPSLRQLWAALSFAGWMATSAVVGAVDVARRALGPRRLVAPQELVENRSLDRGGLLAAALANLLPGSLVHRTSTLRDPGASCRPGWPRS